MEIAERNRAIKKLLSRAFAPHKVTVRGGRGTAYGWVHVDIGYKTANPDQRRILNDKVVALIKAAGLKLGTYYSDMGSTHDEILIRFDRLY